MKVELHPQFSKWKPRTVARWQKMALTHFTERGSSQHSGMAMGVPFIVNYCEKNKIPYVLKAYPGQGYYIEKAPPL